ncbi:MAG: D-2-hydroxyacid dehydrogenase [Candidatus Avilachnospira sp.]|jgi:glycerate dehydrogenase
MKTVILDGYTENPGDLSWEGFGRFGEFEVYERTKNEDIVSRIGDAQVVYTNKTPITEDILEACPNIRFIGTLATGYNVIDTDAAAKRGIPVSNVPGYGTDAVAQHTFALLLELTNHVGEHSECVRRGAWKSAGDFCFWNRPLMELKGKTLGIIGYGSIGKKTAEIGAAFGMKVIYNSRKEYPSDSRAEYRSLDELYRESDIISLHCPLFPETERMINKESIEKMKDGVIIINTSRGGLIDEKALSEALDSEKVKGAAVDVISKEPMEDDNPLCNAKNIIITPHIAWASWEARKRLMDIAVDNLRAFCEGKPQNVVNGVKL